MIERMRNEGKDLAFLNYGFRFRAGAVQEELLHDSMEAVRGRVLDEAGAGRGLDDLGRAVGGAIVHPEDVYVWLMGAHLVDDFPDGGLLIPGRNRHQGMRAHRAAR